LWNSLDEIYLEYLTTDKDFTRNTLFVPLKDYNKDFVNVEHIKDIDYDAYVLKKKQ
jgi:hypothetical protein